MDKTIFVSNLDSTVTKHSLIALFSEYGEIEMCNLHTNKNGTCKGFAYITFQEATSFHRALNSTIYDKGKLLRIEQYIDNNFDLRQKDEELSKLRICVLGVPKQMDSQQFEQIFVSIFGDIENAYIKENLEKKKNLGFVTFRTEQQNISAIKMRKIKLSKSETLSLKKFTARKTHKIGYHEIFQKNKQRKRIGKNMSSLTRYSTQNWQSKIQELPPNLNFDLGIKNPEQKYQKNPMNTLPSIGHHIDQPESSQLRKNIQLPGGLLEDEESNLTNPHGFYQQNEFNNSQNALIGRLENRSNFNGNNRQHMLDDGPTMGRNINSSLFPREGADKKAIISLANLPTANTTPQERDQDLNRVVTLVKKPENAAQSNQSKLLSGAAKSPQFDQPKLSDIFNLAPPAPEEYPINPLSIPLSYKQINTKYPPLSIPRYHHQMAQSKQKQPTITINYNNSKKPSYNNYRAYSGYQEAYYPDQRYLNNSKCLDNTLSKIQKKSNKLDHRKVNLSFTNVPKFKQQGILDSLLNAYSTQNTAAINYYDSPY